MTTEEPCHSTLLADGQEMLTLSHGLALPLAAERETGGCLGKIQHWTATICVPVDGKHAALPGFSPKVTRTSQDGWEQAPGDIILGTEAKQDPQL